MPVTSVAPPIIPAVWACSGATLLKQYYVNNFRFKVCIKNKLKAKGGSLKPHYISPRITVPSPNDNVSNT